MKHAHVPLYRYQKKWLADEARFKIGMFARQTGKTFISTLEIVLDCLKAEASGERRRWVILSRGERQAKEAMHEGGATEEDIGTLKTAVASLGVDGAAVIPQSMDISFEQMANNKSSAGVFKEAAQWLDEQASKSHPYLIYKLGPVQTRHRAEHAAWAGTLLLKDDPWWRMHYPPLRYNCNCYVSLVSRRRYERLTGTRGVRTKPIPDTMMTYVNKRTGATRQVPQGITPGFEWNQGDFGRSAQLALSLMEKAQRLTGRDRMVKIMKEHLAHPIMRDAYKSFVDTALKKEKSTSKMVPLGMLSDTYAKSVASGLVVLQERILIAKQAKHARDDSDLTAAQWQSLPDALQNPDRVYWDHKEENNSLLFVKAAEGGCFYP